MAKTRRSHTSAPRARVRITLNGQQFLLRAPKKYRLMQMQGMYDDMQTAIEASQADPNDAEIRREVVELTGKLTDTIASLFMADDATKTRESSRDRFMAELEDDDSDLDLDDAGEIIALVVDATQGSGPAGPNGTRPTK